MNVSDDSGPFAIYSRVSSYPYLECTAEVPDAVFDRYERAETELRAAEEALDAAIEAWRKL